MRLMIWLFGGYVRTLRVRGHEWGAMGFLSRRSAERYPVSFWGSIDPYAREMDPPEFVPGRLARRQGKI